MVWSRVFKLHKHITKCISLILSKYWFKIINDTKIFHPGKKNTVSSSTILRKPIDLIFICKKKNIYRKQTRNFRDIVQNFLIIAQNFRE